MIIVFTIKLKFVNCTLNPEDQEAHSLEWVDISYKNATSSKNDKLNRMIICINQAMYDSYQFPIFIINHRPKTNSLTAKQYWIHACMNQESIGNILGERLDIQEKEMI